MKERPLLQLYLIYVVTLGAAAFAVYVTYHILVAVLSLILLVAPGFGIELIFSLSIGLYMFFFILVSLPALFVFWELLGILEYGISLSSAFVWYLFGHGALYFIIRLTASPEINVTAAPELNIEIRIGIFIGLLLTVGFALIMRLRKN